MVSVHRLEAMMVPMHRVESICGCLAPIVGVIGLAIFTFLPMFTVGVSGPAPTQHVIKKVNLLGLLQNGGSGQLYLVNVAIIIALLVIIAASALLHTARRS